MSAITDTVGSLFGGGGNSAPATPDYTGAANATAANNLKAAQAATAANRVNQYTPYGSLQYNQSGTDSQGNPMWSATQTPTEPLGSAINANIGEISNQYATPFTGGNLPSYGIDPNQSYTDAIMARLQPQQQMQQKQFDAQMANQGIPVGSEAYQNAARQFQQGQNDQRTSAVVGGMQTGLQANQQQYAQNLGKYQLPLSVANSLKGLANPNYINPAQQATTTGADILGATQAGYNANMGAYNAQQAQQAGMMGGLMGLGGTLGAAYMLAPAASDIRMKENITPIGVADNGLTIYKYEYKPEFKDHKLAGHGVHYGYMAQEVEQVFPYAVHTLNDGYKVVDYGVIHA
jgi:hypothetical protein